MYHFYYCVTHLKFYILIVYQEYPYSSIKVIGISIECRTPNYYFYIHHYSSFKSEFEGNV